MLFPQSEITRDFTSLNKIIYGWPKVGKSTLASVMDDGNGRIPLFIATEDGHGSLAVSRVRVTAWEGFLKLLDHLEKPEVKDRIPNEHSCIVVDLVSDLDAWCSTYVAKMKKVEYVGDMDQGKGWKILKEQFQGAITRLFALAPVTFICHAQDKRVMWNGEQINVQAPSLSKGAMEFINGKVDTIMYVVPATEKKAHPEVSMSMQSGYIAGTRQKALARTFRFDPSNPRATINEINQIYATAQGALVQPAAPAANA